jgi:hypothetical protein
VGTRVGGRAVSRVRDTFLKVVDAEILGCNNRASGPEPAKIRSSHEGVGIFRA